MFLKHIFVLLAAALVSVLAADSHQTVSDFNTLAQKARAVKRAIDTYNGGIPGALRVARAIYDAHSFAETARKNLGNSDPFSDDDSQGTMDAYNAMYPDVISTLKAGQRKAPEFKRSGVGYVAQAMLSHLFNEQLRYEESMHTQLSPNHTRMVQPSIDEANSAWRDTLAAFQN